ncbi:hypothetical protein KEM48_008988 [Puccinia striiformis f. sp. tritici PST-130]|nr:hypothetical protein KEM48_008988 [Puccinia striiformis f. sp. tritici PST-130]
MSTRSAAGSLLPLGDPDAIIRAARRKAKIDAALQDRNPISQNLTLANSALANSPHFPHLQQWLIPQQSTPLPTTLRESSTHSCRWRFNL